MPTTLVLDTFDQVETDLADHVGEIGATWTPTSNTGLAVPFTLDGYGVNPQSLRVYNSVNDVFDLGIATPSGSADLPASYSVNFTCQWVAGRAGSSACYLLLNNDPVANNAYGISFGVINSGTSEEVGLTMLGIVNIVDGVSSSVLDDTGTIQISDGTPIRVSAIVNPGSIQLIVQTDDGLVQDVTWDYDSAEALSGGNVGLFLPALKGALTLSEFSVIQEDTPTPPDPGPTPGTAGFFLSPFGNGAQFSNSEGEPLAGGLLYSFEAGSTTPLATYTTEEGDVANSNPIVLDSAGRVQQEIWQAGGWRYKYHLTDANANVILTLDNIPGINDVTTTVDIYSNDWIDFESVPIRVDDYTFTINGNWSQILHSGRRVKIVQAGGLRYGTVTEVVVTEPTDGTYISTVTMLLDSGVLSSSISQGYYSTFDSVGSPIPVNLALNAAVSTLQSEITAMYDELAEIQDQFMMLLPIGAIAVWPTTTAPSGWSLCDGSPLSRTTDAALFEVIGTTFGTGDGSSTFNKPDLRGKFVRGWDNGAGVDPGRGFATYQADDNKAHTHSGVVRLDPGQNTAISLNRVRYWTAEWATGRNDAPFTNATGTESRPKNIAMNFIIRTGTGV